MNVFCGKDFSFPLAKRTYIMGILNFTPNSFSDGGKYFNVDNAVKRAIELEAEGADIIDVGACSTAPNKEQIDEKTELLRISSVLPLIIKNVSVPVSIDTYRPTVAEFALKNGAKIINDESGRFTREMAVVAKKYNAGWIFMHTGGSNADKSLVYEGGVVKAVKKSFTDFIKKAQDFGIEKKSVCVDMGIGFGKTMSDNTELIKSVNELKLDGVALLTGLSRKRVLNYLTDTIELKDRDNATISANTVAILGGTDIIRVHDVQSAVACAKIADNLKRNNAMGKIIIKDLEIFAYHGVNPEEKENGQRFIIDIVATADLEKACLTDGIEFTTSYAKMIKTASAVFLEKKDDLIERAAYRVADALLSEYTKLFDVKVTVKKPDAPIKAVFGYAAVEIKKERER